MGEAKYKYLVNLMGWDCAKRFVKMKVQQWEDDEFKICRTETKEYWEIVFSYF